MPLTPDQMDIIESMAVELNSAPSAFRPSEYWKILGRTNILQLSKHGVENFKRTVNQNYFNWTPASSHDRQFRFLHRFYSSNPPPAPIHVVLKDFDLFQDLRGKNFLADPVQRDYYCNMVGMLWYYTARTDKHGLLTSLSEPEVGNPVRITMNGKLISQDLANSVRERNVVVDHMGDAKVVAELGAGYGRLAYVFGLTTRCRYLVFDIPPALYVAQWYLGRLFPDRKRLTFRHFERFEEIADELEASDLAFFSPNQLALLPPKYVDVFVTISSLQEMLPEQVENYLQLMSRTTRGIIYLKQYAKWRNPADKVVIRWDDYRVPDWELLLNRRDDVQPRLCEMVYRAPRAPAV